MSGESFPITPAVFAEAIQELPLPVIYAKVSEIRNSMAHLRHSNDELRTYVNESCDTESEKLELEGYITENESVIAAMTERIGLLRAEIEGRGLRWIEVEESGTDINTNGEESSQPNVNGTAEDGRTSTHQDATRRPGDNTQAEQEGEEGGGVYL